MSQPDLDYEFSKQYAHVLVTGMAKEPKNVVKELANAINNYKQTGLNKEHFERIKKKIYGDYVTEYNDVSNIARMFLADYFKGINSFSYLDAYSNVDVEYANKILNEVFNEDKMVVSIIRGK